MCRRKPSIPPTTPLTSKYILLGQLRLTWAKHLITAGKAGDFEQRNNSPLYDVERLTVASDDLKSALVTGTPWAATEARFYTTVGLDLINSYAAEGCDLAQFLISEKVVGYEYLWDTDYLVASSVHDTVHALPPPVIDPELLKPNPIVARLEEQVTMLDECAAKHGNPDHSAMAASLRAMLAITSDFPDKEEKQLLTFQVENANMVLAHC